jgi:hypothetical protein
MSPKNFKLSITVLTLLLSLTISTNSFSQKKNPPGTILLKHNLFIDEIPICNVHYREYEYFLRQTLHFNLDSFEKFVQTLPYYNYDFDLFFKESGFAINNDSSSLIIIDTIKSFWNNWTDFKSYLNHPRFNYFPVVNISSDVAASFCKWRTLTVKLFYSMQKSEKKREKLYNDIVYRLPTIDELELAKAKFSNDKKFMFQPKAKSDSLPTMPEQPQKKNYFRITRLDEIGIDKNFVRQIYWDTTNNLMNKSRLITNKFLNENMTFRCVCEVR